MRVLVTGQSGFTGRYLVAALAAAGHEVLPFDVDITDGRAVGNAVRAMRPDAFVHLAARAFVQSDAIDDFYLVNQIGSFHLLAAAAETSPGAAFLLASSANIYGNAASGHLPESTPANPANHYAVSKLAMEAGAQLWAGRLRLTVTRPFNYTGWGQDTQYVVAKIVDHFRRRASVIELGNIDVRRDFGDVRSVVSAYVGLLDTQQTGTFNICTGRSASLRDIIAICSEMSNHMLEIRVNPAFVRQNDVAVLAGDPAQLRAALPDWKTHSLEETIAWMLRDGGEDV